MFSHFSLFFVQWLIGLREFIRTRKSTARIAAVFHWQTSSEFFLRLGMKETPQ
jgi:hypothetical protein